MKLTLDPKALWDVLLRGLIAKRILPPKQDERVKNLRIEIETRPDGLCEAELSWDGESLVFPEATT